MKRTLFVLSAVLLIPACGDGDSGPDPGDLVYTISSDPSAGGLDYLYGGSIDAVAMYLVGTQDFTGDGQWHIQKRRLSDGLLFNGSDGAHSPVFGSGGGIMSNPSGTLDGPLDVEIDGTAMYVVGVDEVLGAGDQRWRIEKRSLTDGGLFDGTAGHAPTFGTGGVEFTDRGAGTDQATGVAVDAAAVHIIGSVEPTANSGWRIEKRNLSDGGLFDGSDGAHSPLFGTGGAIELDPADSSRPTDIVIDATHMYVAGTWQDGGPLTLRVEKRLLSSGALDGTFGTGGVVSIASGFNTLGLTHDGTALYLAGQQTNGGNSQWVLQKRDLADGALFDGTLHTPMFGTLGEVVINPIGAEASPSRSPVVSGGALYVAGYDELPGVNDSQWRIEKRSAVTGVPVSAFKGGVLLQNFSPTDDRCGRFLAVDSTFLYVGGVDEIPGINASDWRVQALHK